MTMRQSILRVIFRWIHIVFSIPILGYIYSPFEEVPKYAPVVRLVFVPVIVVSGLWIGKAIFFGDLFHDDRSDKTQL